MSRIDNHDINDGIQGTLAGPLSAGRRNPPESDRIRRHTPHSADVLQRTELCQTSAQWERVHGLTQKDEWEGVHDISVCAQRADGVRGHTGSRASSVHLCIAIFGPQWSGFAVPNKRGRAARSGLLLSISSLSCLFGVEAQREIDSFRRKKVSIYCKM